MQRIKSQSTCMVANNSLFAQARPKSKKNAKAQSSEIIYTGSERTKSNNTQVITQHSVFSSKSNSKLVNASTKNLRATHQSTAKNSVQNTSRANGQNSAISARILKEIVGYTNRGVGNKPKFNKDYDNKQEITLKIDLDYEMSNLASQRYEKSHQAPRTTLSDHHHPSQQTTPRKEAPTGNSTSKQKSKGKQDQKHRVVQQFSPMNLSPNKQSRMKTKSKSNSLIINREFTQKRNQMVNVDDMKITASQPNCNEQSSIQGSTFNNLGNELNHVNFETWNNYSSFHEVGQQKNILEITNNFLKIQSPHNLLSSLYKSPLAGQQSTCTVQNYQPVAMIFNKQSKGQSIVAQSMTEQQNLLSEKQRLIACLEQSSAVIQSNFEIKFKQLIPFWKTQIETQAQLAKTSQSIKQLQTNLAAQRQIEYIKKTELFQLNRDQLSRKKQKDYFTKSSKQRYLQQAVNCQQNLKARLSSKADYQHVILFNEKVVLTGEQSFDNLSVLFTEMFENKLTKKFALIAKKQLSNLSMFDSRLVQDFLKRVQQLQSQYLKIEPSANTSHQQSIINQYSTANEQQRLESLVDQIQQLTLNLQFLNSTLQSRQTEAAFCVSKIKECGLRIQDYINSTNAKISGEYKMVQGCSFDFETLLQKQVQAAFVQFREQLQYREQIVDQLNSIQTQLNILRNTKSKKNSLCERNKQSYSKQSHRNSISYGSTPSQRSVQKQNQLHCSNMEMQISNMSQLFKKNAHY